MAPDCFSYPFFVLLCFPLTDIEPVTPSLNQATLLWYPYTCVTCATETTTKSTTNMEHNVRSERGRIVMNVSCLPSSPPGYVEPSPRPSIKLQYFGIVRTCVTCDTKTTTKSTTNMEHNVRSERGTIVMSCLLFVY